MNRIKVVMIDLTTDVRPPFKNPSGIEELEVFLNNLLSKTDSNINIKLFKYTEYYYQLMILDKYFELKNSQEYQSFNKAVMSKIKNKTYIV